MKLRMLESSVRLRLTRPEVESFGRGERIQSTARFPNGGVFGYALSVTAGDLVTARFEDDCLEVLVPRSVASDWAFGDAVAIAAEQPTTGGVFSILVEKDFACLNPREDASPHESFPNPRAASFGSPSPIRAME